MSKTGTMDTDALIAYYQTQLGGSAREALACAIPDAIDAAYSERDNGGTMHSAGAASAVAAIKAYEAVLHETATPRP